MKLRYLAVLFAFVLAAAAANAQAGVYATFDAEQFARTGLYVTPPAGVSNSSNAWLYGPTFGVYYTVSKIPKLGTLHTGPVAIGIDLRGDILRTNTQLSRDDGLIGLRVSPRGAYRSFKPYVQGSAGIGHTKVPGQLNFSNNFSYQFALGADRKLKGRLDWRVVEAGAGFLGSYAAGASNNSTNYNYFLSSGFVVRLGGK